MNTQKKEIQKKKEKPKGERTSAPRPLSWNIYVKSNVDTPIELDTIMCAN